LPDAETKLDKGCVKRVPVERPGEDGHGSRSSSYALLTDRCYGLDLHELVGIAENTHSYEGAGYVVGPESLADHVPHVDEVVPLTGSNQHPCAHDVGELRSTLGQCLLQVAYTGPRLLDELARGRSRAVWIQWASAGEEEKSVA